MAVTNKQVALNLRVSETADAIDFVADVMRFSPYKCFPLVGDKEEINLIKNLAKYLLSQNRPIIFIKVTAFTRFLLQHANDLVPSIVCIIDPKHAGEEILSIPVVESFNKYHNSDVVAFISTLKTEELWRLKKLIPDHVPTLTPDIVKTLGSIIPARSWIPDTNNVYPINLPGIDFADNLDILLMTLPAAYNTFQMPVGIAYVQKALKRAELKYQTFDFSIIHYHRVSIHEQYDLGETLKTRNGLEVSDRDQNRIWTDPRLWPYLIELFETDIVDIVDETIRSKPKVVGFSVHQNNEWISREVARRIKKALPNTMILVGGHSCYAADFGANSFPEYDYMVIGEADMVVGPLVKELAQGKRPKNTPGVISQYDDADYQFIPGPVHHDLDLLGHMDFDAYDNINEIYQSCIGERTTAIPLTRGCVWSRCTFCAERFAFRTRTAKNYVDEIESMVNSGRDGTYQTCDSDFGGNPDVIHEVCEEIIRRGLKINFSGQIRINKKYDYEFFKLMKRAGIHTMNFGMDAVTDRLLRLQKKGYTSEMLLQNLEDCYRAGIAPSTNFVIGIPHETKDDIQETLDIIARNKRLFPMIHNVNAFELVNNSVYWLEPEKHDIYFYGSKDEIYSAYTSGVPQSLWYSLNPFMDRTVRFSRLRQLVGGINSMGIGFTNAALSNYNITLGDTSFLEARNMMHDPALSLTNLSAIRLPEKENRTLNISNNFKDHLVIVQPNGSSFAVPYRNDISEALQALKISHWHDGELLQ